MTQRSLQRYFSELASIAGFNFNGTAPWDPQIHDDAFFLRVFKENSLGLGESYMDGWWDCQNIDQLFDRLLRVDIETKVRSNTRLLLRTLLLKFINIQTKAKSLIVGKNHYDLGNDLFEAMLDKHMNYTCGFWSDSSSLDEAQLNKLDLTCQKLMLKPGMRLLDIGCGFGALAKHAATYYGVQVVGVTISKEQHAFARRNCENLPVEIRFQDYREVNESFDRIASLGMFEHVGHLNYGTYMQVAKRCLKTDGLFLLHTIGNNTTHVSSDPWISKYIFPNGMIPSIAQIAKASEGVFVMEDWHNFGADYDKTLMAWHANFEAHWNELKSHYDERFRRMWNYYLLSCAGAFRARNIQLWQVVFSKEGVLNGYQSIRPTKFEMIAPKNRDASPPVTAL